MVEKSEDSEDSALASLSPLERWKYLAKYNRSELVMWLLAFFGGAYMVISAGFHLGISIFS